jgi:hypothetical protein
MPTKPFNLQFPAADLQKYADEYSYPREPADAIAAGQKAADDGRYTRDGVLAVVNWKSARTKDRITTDAVIRAATADAFATDDETARMEALTTLPGVGVPVASALLLFACGESYPILDVNALASLGHKRRGVYPTEFWVRYLTFVRHLAAENGMSARTVEKALWENDKQRKASC